MIRDVNFFFFFSLGEGWGGFGAKGGWHLVMSRWLSERSGRGRFWRKTPLNLQGLLLHLPVNEHCCWRYPCVPCHEAEQAAPSPDALTTQENGSRCDRCFRGPGDRAMGEAYSQVAGMYRRRQLLQHVSAWVLITP